MLVSPGVALDSAFLAKAGLSEGVEVDDSGHEAKVKQIGKDPIESETPEVHATEANAHLEIFDEVESVSADGLVNLFDFFGLFLV